MGNQPMAALRTLGGRARRPVLRDTVAAGVLIVLCVLANDPYSVVEATAAAPLGGVGGDRGAAWAWWIATAGILTAVMLRRRAPVAMLVVGTLCTASHVALAVPPMVVDVGALVLLATVAAHRGRAVSLTALGALAVLVVVGSAHYAFTGRQAPGLPSTVIQIVHREHPPAGPDEAITTLRHDPSANMWNTTGVFGLALVAAWSLGSGVRSRRAYLDQLYERARDFERGRDQRAALAVAAERGRISRDMHDVVAHGLSVIVIQAQGAAAALDDEPAETKAALDAIVAIGRDSLADMRRVLDAVGETDDAWHPPPGLGQLDALLGRVDNSGTPVRLRVSGKPVELPSAVDLSAYRIIQEALTNTIKHAGPGASAEVSLAYRETEIGVRIRDDGTGVPRVSRLPGAGDPGGNGLRGMRERTRLLGGRFTAGPAPRGGFVIDATLPVHRHQRPRGPRDPAGAAYGGPGGAGTDGAGAEAAADKVAESPGVASEITAGASPSEGRV